MPKLPAIWKLALAFAAAALSGCGGEPCRDLQAVCDACPATSDGTTAAASCQGVVTAGDEEACQARLDARLYESFGCNP